jgi:Na+/phosphate symporter
MARRRKSTKRRSSRRRMGAVGKANIQAALGIIAGAVIGTKVAGFIPVGDERIKNAAVLGIGLAFPMILKGELGKAIGNGMIAAGGAGLVGGLIPALGQMDDTMTFPVTVGEIPDNISVIAGSDDVMAGDDLSVLAGMEEDEMY